jgi:hypothetical protein
MKPYTSSFYDMIKQFHNDSWILKPLTEECKEDLNMWKAFLCLLVPFEQQFSRSLMSFEEREPKIKIEYDASLMGLGVVLSLRIDGRWEIIQHVGIEFPFREEIKNDSSFQNSCEFIAIVIGVYMTAILGYRDFGYCLHGDNVSSLSWAVHGGGISPRAKAASMALALINIRIQSNLTNITHVPGKMNVVADGLSRGKRCEELELSPLTTSPNDTCVLILELLNVINPVISFSSQGNRDSVRQKVLKILGNTILYDVN